MRVFFTEEYPEINGSFSFEIDKILFSQQSGFQKIEIVKTPKFGRVLLIDGFVMLTERDEFVYHEMIAHTPLFVHPNPRQVLIIGGGDGGAVRECHKHKSIQHIDLVDIDEVVSQACLKYFPSVAHKLLSEKVNCIFQDGIEYVKKCPKKYDLIIIDSTDPISVGEVLFTREFYSDCYDILGQDGILVNQSESPSWMGDTVKQISKKLNSVFPSVHFFQAHIPSYPSGHWAFGFASKRYHPLQHFQDKCYDDFSFKLKYYNKDLHFGSFAIPTFFKELTDE